MTCHNAIRCTRYILIAVVLFVFVPAGARSESVVELSARAKVQDQAGRPVPGALVGVYETDWAGNYKKSAVAPKGPSESGQYNLQWKAEKDRYYVLQAEVQGGGDKPLTKKSRVFTTASPPPTDPQIFTFNIPVERKPDSLVAASPTAPQAPPSAQAATEATGTEKPATLQQPASTGDDAKTSRQDSPPWRDLWLILWVLVAASAFVASIFVSVYFGARRAFHETVRAPLLELSNRLDQFSNRLDQVSEAELKYIVTKVSAQVEQALAAHEHTKLAADLSSVIAAALKGSIRDEIVALSTPPGGSIVPPMGDAGGKGRELTGGQFWERAARNYKAMLAGERSELIWKDRCQQRGIVPLWWRC